MLWNLIVQKLAVMVFSMPLLGLLSCGTNLTKQEEYLGASSTTEQTKPSRTSSMTTQPSVRTDQTVPKTASTTSTTAHLNTLINTPMAHEFEKIAKETDVLMAEQLKKFENLRGFTRTVGLKNCGNTCYMNALLQSLLHSDLGKYTEVPFNQITFSKDIDKNKSLFKIFYDLAANYRRGTGNIDTSDIATARETFMPTLSPGQQDDAEEYLRFFFVSLGVELNLLNKAAPSHRATDDESANFLFQYYWVKAGKYGEYSVVQDLFGGFLKNVLTKNNGTKSTIYDFSTSLPLAFPASAKDTSTFTLDDLLVEFQKDEPITDSPGNRSRRLSLYKTPKTLIVQLKRFPTVSKKISANVTYPSRLNLTTEFDGPTEFDLFAVVIHSGSSLSGGHYTAYVKDANNRWQYANDKDISDATKAQVLQQKAGAYLLFYRKISSR